MRFITTALVLVSDLFFNVGASLFAVGAFIFGWRFGSQHAFGDDPRLSRDDNFYYDSSKKSKKLVQDSYFCVIFMGRCAGNGRELEIANTTSWYEPRRPMRFITHLIV